MKNSILNVVALVALILPFAAVAYELAMKESITTVAVFGGIALVLAATVVMALVVSRPKRS